MKNLPLAQVVLAAFSLAPIIASATDEIISGNLTVEQNLLVHQTVEVGQAILGSVNYPAYGLQVNSTLGTTILDQTAYGTITTWNWLTDDGTDTKQLLKLENTGKLLLYNPTSPTAAVIVLDAGGEAPEITIMGKRVVTEGNIGAILGNSGSGGKVAIGTGPYATTQGTYSVAVGWSASTADYATALGCNSFATGNYAVSIGTESGATDHESIAIGYFASALKRSSLALGTSASAESDYSIALGYQARALGNNSSALGMGAYANHSYQVALGSYNQSLENAYFMLGNGTDFIHRSNLFVIMKDGRGIFRNTNYVEPTIENPQPVQPVALTVDGSTEINGSTTIKGDAKVTGILRVKPAGDLSMGVFTAGSQP